MTTKIGAFTMIAGVTFEEKGFDCLRLDKVTELAQQSHVGQERKFSREPYIYHPISVATTILELDDPNLEEMVLAALLHDVLEDTKTTEQEIVDVAGPKVLKLVQELTNPSKNCKASRAASKQMDREHLATVSREAKIIKLADRLDNIKDIASIDDSFKFIYIEETRQLLPAIYSACPYLGDKILDICENFNQ